ncbi:hypothetical protein SNEBB_007052 [Seison nebaliae]|nr:hypothetical protein SNEBB_007052 [Seison nebaliae]
MLGMLFFLGALATAGVTLTSFLLLKNSEPTYVTSRSITKFVEKVKYSPSYVTQRLPITEAPIVHINTRPISTIMTTSSTITTTTSSTTTPSPPPPPPPTTTSGNSWDYYINEEDYLFLSNNEYFEKLANEYGELLVSHHHQNEIFPSENDIGKIVEREKKLFIIYDDQSSIVLSIWHNVHVKLLSWTLLPTLCMTEYGPLRYFFFNSPNNSTTIGYSNRHILIRFDFKHQKVETRVINENFPYNNEILYSSIYGMNEENAKDFENELISDRSREGIHIQC